MRFIIYDDFEIDKIIEVVNEKCNFNDSPEDLCRFIFIALPKKAAPIEFWFHLNGLDRPFIIR